MSERDTFVAAVAAREGPVAEPAVPPQPPVAAPPAVAILDTPVGVVDTATAEVLDFAEVDHAFLAGIVDELRRREAQIKQWRELAEAELVERHGDRKAPQVLGDWEVNVERKWSREWDAEELEGVLDDLVSRGLLDPRQAGLVTTVAKVDGTAAVRLLRRVDGEALDALHGCFTWKEGRPRVTVTAVPDLADALPRGPA